MNHVQKIEKLRLIFNRCLQIAEAKGHDYSGGVDAMSNFHDFGWKGIVVRLGDKYHRLKNFAKQGVLKVEDESIDDTLLDLINYSALCLIEKELECELTNTTACCNVSSTPTPPVGYESVSKNLQNLSLHSVITSEKGYVPIR